jgi:hypothetical protein
MSNWLLAMREIAQADACSSLAFPRVQVGGRGDENPRLARSARRSSGSRVRVDAGRRRFRKRKAPVSENRQGRLGAILNEICLMRPVFIVPGDTRRSGSVSLTAAASSGAFAAKAC